MACQTDLASPGVSLEGNCSLGAAEPPTDAPPPGVAVRG